MKIAILSDIHSNDVALEACINVIEREKVDYIIGLGDYVSDCPNPRNTLKLLTQLKERYETCFIRGNREEYFLDYADGKIDNWTYSSYTGSLLYTYEHLAKEDLDWFGSMSNSTELILPGVEPITLAHGSPFSTRELLDYEQDNTNHCLTNISTEYMIAGHTHRQMIYRYKQKILVNPGSVGVAIGVTKKAHMAVLEWREHRWHTRLLSVPFDYDLLKRKFLESRLMDKGNVWPRAILKSMETGINYGPLCAKLAYDLAVEAHEVIEHRIVKEKYWIMAAKYYGVL